jgi:hypothetical protein
MKRLLSLALGFITLLGMGLLAGCDQPKPDPLPIPAPQNVLTIPDDKNVIVIWDAVDDARVTGYNVYQDGVVVNPAPIKAASRVSVRASGDPIGRLRFTVENVTTSGVSKFSVGALTATATGPVSDISEARTSVCERHKVEGVDMGKLKEVVRLTKGGVDLTTGSVTVVFGQLEPGVSHIQTTFWYVPGFGLYLSSSIPEQAVGNVLEILTRDGDCRTYSYDSIPESPVLTAPAASTTLNVTNALPVAWTSATNPDRFVVLATWAGSPTWRSGDLAGTTRTFSIPANTLPADKTVKIKVYAYNDGTEKFIGAFEPGSRMGIHNGDEAGRDITTIAPPPAVAANPGVTWGDPHLISFDQVAFEFQTVGEYDLGFSSDNHVRVQARHQPWGGSPYVSVNTAIATRMNGQKVGLYINPPAGQSPLRIGDLGTRTDVPATGLDLGAGFKILKDGPMGYKFEYPDGDIMKVEMHGTYINAKIYPILTRAGTMKGLLGNFDGGLFNEFIKREGGILPPLTTLALVREYATSWSIPTVADSLFVYDPTEAFGGFSDSSFPTYTPPADPTTFATAQADCTAAGVQPKNINACAVDKTQTGDNSFITNATTIQNPAQLIVLEPALPPILKPDLIVQSATASLGATCRPNNTFLTVSVVVKNIGTATAVGRSDVGVVGIVDARDEALASGARGNSVGIPTLAPNATTTLNITLGYPTTTPDDTEGLRSYVARVDLGNWYDELVETNNRLATTIDLNVPVGHCKNRVAIIYGVDATVANAYKPGFTAKGFRVTNLAIADLNMNSTYTNYDLIVIDSKSGSGKDWQGDTFTRDAIRDAGKPLLGIGEGGYSYMGQLLSPLGNPSPRHTVASVTNFAIPSTIHPSTSSPFLPVSSGGEITITTSPMQSVSLLLNTPPSSIQLVAKESGVTDYYLSALNTTPTSTTGSSEALWGLDGLPTYTEDGWKVLANLMWFMLP